MSSWERGLRRLRDAPGPRDAAPVPWQEGTVLCLADLHWDDGTDVVASPRQILRRQIARLAERGLGGLRRHRARVHRLPRHLRGGVEEGLPRPRAGQPLQRRLLAAGHRAGRAADPPDPQLDDGGGHARRELQGRVQLRPARDQLPLRPRARRPRTSTRIYKNGAKEIAAQEGMAITFMAKFNEREGNSCHIHLSVAPRGRLAAVRRRAADVRPLRRRPARAACAELTLFFAPNINSYKRFAEGSFAPTAVAWGNDNRHLLAARRRPRARPGGSSARLPGADVNPYLALSAMIAARPARHRQRARARTRRRRATRTAPTSPASRRRCATRATCSHRAPSPARRSATTSSTTTSTTRASSSRRSTPPSPTGSASAASSACEPARRSGSPPRSSR